MRRAPSIRLRIFLGMLIGILGFLGSASFVLDALLRGVLEAEIADSVQRAHEAWERYARLRRSLLLDQARALARSASLRAALAAPEADGPGTEAVRELVGLSPKSLLLAADAEARLVVGGDPAPADLSDQPGARYVLDGGEFVGVWCLSGRLHEIAVCPVRSGDRVVGLAAVGERVDERTARELRGLTGRDVTLLHEEDLLARAWEVPGEADLAAALVPRPWSELSPLRLERVEIEDRAYLALAIPAGGELTVVLSRPLDAALAHFRSAQRDLTLVALAFSALALLVSRRLAERVGRPIQAVVAAAGELARGRLDTTVPEADDRELASLARSFNEMARRIELLVGAVTDQARSAEAANEAKSVFLRTMSHEIRTPLTGVLGFTEQLLEGPLDSAQREHARMVQSSGQALLELVDDVLDFSRIEAGELELDERPFSLRDALSRAVNPLRSTARRKGLELLLDVDRELPDRFLGDGVRLRQIVTNFVGNAVKFTELGGVTVRAQLVERAIGVTHVRIAVIDTGIGIPGDRLARLFRPFYQVDSSHGRRFGGSGLGLAIAKNLAERMSGEVGVESRPGDGSTFWVYLPLREEPVGPAQTERAAGGGTVPDEASARADGRARRARRAGQRILVVEDNPVLRKMAGLVLSKAGWSCAFADDGRRALARLLSEGPFDLVLMDCQMPVMDGYEATRRLRERESGSGEHLPVVAVTANAVEGDRATCLAAGMDDYLRKPFRGPELVSCCDRWLGNLTEAEPA